MAKLSPAAFAAKWTPLLANNVFQDIDGTRLGQLVADIRDSFAASTDGVNVPDWQKGTYYPYGFVILHGITNTFYKAVEAGYLDSPSSADGAVYWQATLSPVSDNALYQVGTVPALRAARGRWAPGRLYVLNNRTDPDSGDALSDVYVRALSAGALEPVGFMLDNSSLAAMPVAVSYDLANDVTGPVAEAGYSDADIDARLATKAPLASPRFTGTPQAPTLGTVNSSDQLATTRFVQNLLALSYTNAYPFVCVRASDTSLSIAQFTLDNAIKWANLGGPGSVVYVNRPCTLGDIAVLAAGVILDLQHNPLDLAGSVIRLGNKAEIRNNRLMFSGRLAPDYGDGTPFSFTVRGGTLAGRLNYLVNNEATCILDGVVVADFGQQLLGGLNVGMATSSEVGPKVLLRNGAYFSAAYPPHPNTVVTTEAPAPGGDGGGSYSDAEAAAAALASLVAGNNQHQGVQVSDVNGVPKLTVAGAVIDIVRLRMPAAGSGNLAEGQDLRDADAGGSYRLTATANVARFAIINPAGPNTLFDGKATDFPAAGVPLQGSTWFTYQIVSVDVTQPVFLELSLIH